MRRVVLTIAAVAALAGAAAGPAAAGKVADVELGTSCYAPAKVTVKKGDRVRFRWKPSFDMLGVDVAASA